MLKLEQLYALLTTNNVSYTIVEDNLSLKTASVGAKHYGISLQETTPTFILKTDEGFIAAIICGNTRLVFKKLRSALRVKNVTMANAQEVFDITGARIGEVGLINPKIKTVIDINVLKNKDCYGGCGLYQKTLRIGTHDLIKITNAQILDFAQVRT